GGETDLALLPDRGWVMVAYRGALGYRAGSADRAGRGEQRLDQSRLAGAGVPHKHHVADPAGVFHHRRCAGDPLLLAFLRHRAHLPRAVQLGERRVPAPLRNRNRPTPIPHPSGAWHKPNRPAAASVAAPVATPTMVRAPWR